MKRLLGNDASIDAHGFRLRGRDVSRAEALSDAVFGFAITLLVVSLEVPHSFDDLLTMMTGFVSFGICFAMLLMVWHTHVTFFTRYGLRDFTTVVLNAILLFVVVFYIYPLKFMFTMLLSGVFGIGRTPGMRFDMTGNQVVTLMELYSLSIVAVFGVFVAMFAHAWRQREALALDALERHMTITSILYCAIWMSVGALAIALAAFGGPRLVALAGISFSLLGPLQGLNGWLRGRSAPKRGEG
jgi:uncharacterized membrane protein